MVTRMEAITCDVRYDGVTVFQYVDDAHDEADLELSRQFVVMDSGARTQTGAQGADNSPSELVADLEVRILYVAAENADELRKVLAEDVDRIRYTLQRPAEHATDGVIHRKCGEAQIETPDGESAAAYLTIPVAARYRPSF